MPRRGSTRARRARTSGPPRHPRARGAEGSAARSPGALRLGIARTPSGRSGRSLAQGERDVFPGSRGEGRVIERLMELSVRNRLLVLLFAALLALVGAWSLATAGMDAIPDLSENQVIVFAEWPGKSPRE